MKLSLVLVVGVALAAQAAAQSRPPATRIDPVTETLHGVALTDPYRWLEGDNSNPERMGQVTPEVAAWTDAQNAYTRAVLDGFPSRKALEDRMRPLMEIGSVGAPTMRGNRYFFTKREGNQNQPVVYYRDGHKGETKTLLDPAKIDSSGLTTVTWFSPTEDGKQVAYGTYRAGDENTTLHLMEVETGKVLPLEIPNKTQSPDWLPDGSGFVYQNLDDPKNPYRGRVLFHRMGTDPAQDAVLFRQFTKEENEKLATTWGPSGSLSRDGKWLVLGYATSTRSNDLWVADFEAWRATGKLEKKEVTVGGDGAAYGDVVDGTLFLYTNQGAPNGRVVAVDPKNPAKSAWKELVPERKDAVIQTVSVARGVLAVEYLKNAASSIELFDFDGKPAGELKMPGIGSASLAVESDRTEAYLSFTSFNYPNSIFRVDLAKAGRRARALGAPGGASRPVDGRGEAGLVCLEGRHEGLDVRRAQEGARARRRAADDPQRLRRLQHLGDPVLQRAALPVVRGRRRLRAAQPARRRRVRRRSGTRPGCSSASRTSSTTSSRRASGWSPTATRSPRSSPATAARTAAC